MPVKGSRGSARHSSGPKHKLTKKYMNAYWPYMPMVVIIIIGLFFGSYQPQHSAKTGVLAYATSTTSGGLLQSTNSQRTDNGVAGLTLNSQLNSAAQTKADDMVARNYWSHVTPDNLQPWVFIQNAGYSYTKAGENLAYGFGTSAETITGWMNSVTHRANLLDSGFTEVGFGIANAPNFISTGQETIVVAMYGKPQVLGASSTAAPAPTVATSPSPPKAATTAPVITPSTLSTPVASSPDTAASPAVPEVAKKEASKPVSTANPLKTEPASLSITRAQTITGGKTPWLVSVMGFIASLAVLALLLKHSLQIKSLIQKSEKFPLHHPIFDTAMVSAIMIAYVLSSTTGFIR